MTKQGLLDFDSARAIVRTYGLSGRDEWRAYIEAGKLPSNIPRRPDHTYRDKWKGWKDWCGYEGYKPRVEFMPFDEARAFVRNLKLRTITEWKSYHRSFFANKAHPRSIPLNPDRHYREWVSFADWLGDSYSPYTSSKKLVRLGFIQCREFARGLGLQGQKEWRNWAKSSHRPIDVPANPEAYYKYQGWIGWPDWLGYKERGKWPLYEDAKAIVSAKGFKSMREFKKWSETDEFPPDIPKDPRWVYADSGWKNSREWLGNGKLDREEYWDFSTAREWVRSYVKKKGGVMTHAEWTKFCKSPQKPIYIFSNPKSYPEFVSWADWFGVPDGWLPFKEARSLVRNLELRTKEEWNVWKDSDSYDPRVPKAPHTVYRGKNEWAGMQDWLGTSHRRFVRDFRAFEEARAFVRNLGLRGKAEWETYTHSPAFPLDIPVTPSKTYVSKWVSWSDWLGNYGSRWSMTALIGFLKALVPLLPKLEPSELFAILRQNNCLGAIDSLGDNNPLVMITKAALNGEQALVSELTNVLQSKVGDLPSLNDDEEQDIEPIEANDSIDVEVSSGGSDREEASLPNLTAREILDALDDVSKALGISDEETINFLVDKGVSRLWQSVLGAIDQRAEVEKTRAFSSDTYAQTIKNRFIEEFDSVEAIPIPVGYEFAKAGKPVLPNLMQRLIAHRLTTMKRVGNWSGTGAGKTLAAVLGSRVVNSDLTLVIALNNTINDPNAGWALEIKSAFPTSHVQIKERGVFFKKLGVPTYLLLNYEAFQLADSRSMVEHLVRDHRIDLIVLDEIHSAKSRNAVESKRRQLLNYLITESGRKNQDLKVLGMSATPVVNSLDEAASLLEMITSKDYADLDTRATISNALGMHQQLILNGVRYRPNYRMELREEAIEIKADDLTDRILNLRKGDVLGLEKILLESKLPCVLDLAKPGTIIFSNFVDGIFDTVTTALKAKGLKAARFSGEDKAGLEEFKRGHADVLVGSSALGTGVDGLQYICNRLIIVTLPWTSAGYEQLLGRIYRQGSRFETIEVYIPQVVLSHEGQEWSWDKQRFGRIKYKKTLADAAVDGFVPEGKLMSQEKMFSEARKVLEEWIQSLEDGHALTSVRRPDLKVPLPPDQLSIALVRYGDFSRMNARIGSSASETTNKRFQENPEEWYLYHSLYKEARKTWSEVPYVVIGEGLSKRPDWVVGDFGCGEALLSAIIPNKVFSFDHVAINETVEACDMTKTSLPDEALDVAVFSLSLMGLNWEQYLSEAYRVLKPGGFIEIAEPASKWEGEKLDSLVSALTGQGFQIVGEPRCPGKFVYIRGVKV